MSYWCHRFDQKTKKSFKKIVGFLVEPMAPKGHFEITFEINTPLPEAVLE